MSTGGPFEGNGTHWRYQHPGYEAVVAPLLDSSTDGEVVQLTTGRDGEQSPTPDDWPWERAIWARRATDGAGVDVWVHDAPDYEWAQWESLDESALVRILDGDWPTCSGDISTVARYRTIATDDDEQSHLEWGGLDGADIEWHSSSSETPFATDFDLAPATQTTVNEWSYEPITVSSRDSWVSPCGNKEVTVHQNTSDFSWVTVTDRRLRGAASRHAPDGCPSKVQSDLSAAAAREVAVEWMEAHDPDLWQHEGYEEALYDPPEGWEVLKRPTIGSGQPKELSVSYGQSAAGPYTRVLQVRGPLNSTEFEVHLAYRRLAELIHREHEWCYYDRSPTEVPQRATITRVYEIACELAAEFDGPEIDTEIKRILAAHESGAVRGTGPWGAITAEHGARVAKEIESLDFSLGDEEWWQQNTDRLQA